MPKVYYPFPADHVHAGKFYPGLVPAGDIKGMLERSGARLAEPLPELGLAADPPPADLIVTEADVLCADVAAATEQCEALKRDLTAAGKGSLVARFERTITASAAEAKTAIAAGDLIGARAACQRAEAAVQQAETSLGNMIAPAPSVPQARLAQPRKAAPAAEE